MGDDLASAAICGRLQPPSRALNSSWPSTMSQTLQIYTVGHSDHTIGALIDLLVVHGITLVVDVRSQPYSRWAPQFNRETLDRDLKKANIAYRFMGEVLGGRPVDPELHTDGRPDYRRMEETEVYQQAINELVDLVSTEHVALMCGEGDHLQCHRHLLISQTLLKRGAAVLHIKPDGRLVQGEQILEQLSLL